VAKRKGPKKKKGAGAGALTPSQSERLKELLAHPEHMHAADIRDALPDAVLARAYVERMPADDPGLIPILTAIRDAFPEKTVQKAVRRTAFRFEQQGAHVPAAPESDSAGLRPNAPQGEPFAFLSPLDGMGSRGVLLGLPRAPSGYELGVALTHDEAGILQFAGGSFSKKKAMGARNEFLEEFSYNVETSLEHAVSVLERSHRANPEAPGAAPYLRARPWILDRVTLPETPAAYELIDREELLDQTFTAGMAIRLLQQELLAAWFLDPDEVRALIEDIREAERSPIVLSDDQQDNRIEEIKREWVREKFTPAKRGIFRERLEETAYILHRRGHEEEARFALLAAQSLEEEDSLFDINPFLRLLLERTLDLLREAPGTETGSPGSETGHAPSEDEGSSSSGIIIP